MAELNTTYPPDIYTTQSDGAWAWNTDGKIDDGVYASGDSSVKFKDTTPAATTYAQLNVATDFIVPVAPGDKFVMEGTCRADDNDADQRLFMGVHYYNAAKVWQSNAELWGDNVDVINTWEIKRSAVFTVPDGIAYMGHYFGKRYDSADPSFNGWWDSVYIDSVRPSVLAYLSADQSLADGGEYVIFDSEIYDYGGNYDTGTGEFTAPVAGRYLVNSTAQIELLDTNEVFYLGATRVSGMTTTRYLYSPMVTANGDNWSMPTQVSGVMHLLAGDIVKIWAVHNHGSDLNCTGANLPGGIFASSFSVELLD